MKLTICSCARCTASGNEFLLDSAREIKTDLEYTFEIGASTDRPEVEIIYENIMDEVEDPEKSAPVAKIDDELILNAKPEVLMERIFDEFTPEEEV